MSTTTRIQQREAQYFCTRKSHLPKTCQVHRPTLEELQSLSFIEYVQKVVLAMESKNNSNDNDKNNTTHLEDDDNDNLASKSKEPTPYMEGMAKVILPKGFSNERGIGQDRSGRGTYWQEGGAMGDFVIPSPIKQCIRGIGGIYEYTFLDQPSLTVSEYREKADEYGKKNHLPQQDCDNQDNNDNPEEDDQKVNEYLEMIQRKFWRRLCPTMPAAMYGADMEGSLFGFEDSASGWNLGKINSCLHLLGKVPGVTSPYLYFGMWASVFAAHTEDMNLLSVNYLHAGAPKIWYAIAPGHDSKRFETLAQGYFPDAFSECSEFLRHKRYLLSPTILQKAGIPFTVQVQRPGEAMITLPGGYHFGFNAGFNVAEATNFGVPEWIPYGIQAKICKCRPDSVRIDMTVLQRLFQRYERDIKDNGNKDMTWREWGILQYQGAKKKTITKTTTKKQTANNNQQKATEEKPETTKSSPGKKTTTAAAKQQQRKTTKKPQNQSKQPAKSATAKNPKKRSKSPSPQKKKTTTKSTSNKKQKKNLSIQEKKHEFWVEVMQTAALRKKTTAKKKKNQEEEELWHLAKPAKSLKSLQPQTRVLCMRPCLSSNAPNDGKKDQKKKKSIIIGGDEDDDEQCFLGTIVEIVDDHGRIHLDGFTKKDDIWMPLESKKLFLDGGKWDDSCEEDALPSNHYWKEMDSKKIS